MKTSIDPDKWNRKGKINRRGKNYKIKESMAVKSNLFIGSAVRIRAIKFILRIILT